jgi:hypothetical protein
VLADVTLQRKHTDHRNHVSSLRPRTGYPASRTTPAYAHSLLWWRDNRHPLLPALIAHVRAGYRPPTRSEVWLPPAEQSLFAAS